MGAVAPSCTRDLSDSETAQFPHIDTRWWPGQRPNLSGVSRSRRAVRRLRPQRTDHGRTETVAVPDRHLLAIRVQVTSRLRRDRHVREPWPRAPRTLPDRRRRAWRELLAWARGSRVPSCSGAYEANARGRARA